MTQRITLWQLNGSLGRKPQNLLASLSDEGFSTLPLAGRLRLVNARRLRARHWSPVVPPRVFPNQPGVSRSAAPGFFALRARRRCQRSTAQQPCRAGIGAWLPRLPWLRPEPDQPDERRENHADRYGHEKLKRDRARKARGDKSRLSADRGENVNDGAQHPSRKKGAEQHKRRCAASGAPGQRERCARKCYGID
jgi:hypothetical protein